ncbi:hypothetical protein EB796_015130 [Bugula neritina]|uniref:CASP2 n=1 Tax=Bugula neritina TaxID=10212 RepID=A0A7J7JJP0_BUGNE|nr:hypothetical protein EB796_015130 [Bugula neritina]
MNPSWVQYHDKRLMSSLLPSEAKHFTCKKDPSVPECLLNPISSLSEEQKEDLSKFLSKYEKALPEDETQVESDAESNLSDHEDFYLPGDDHHVKMQVSVTRKAAIKRLFYSNQQMKKDIKDETERSDHEDYGMHITVLMSHGATYGAYGMLYGTDLKLVKLLDVFDLLSSDNFKHMAGKPKVVILLACREGTFYKPYPSHYQTNTELLYKQVNTVCQKIDTKPVESSNAQNERKRFNIDDMLILQSCFDGRKSYRHSNYGSPFIRELVKTLYKHSSHTDLATLFDIVQERVKKVTKSWLRNTVMLHSRFQL